MFKRPDYTEDEIKKKREEAERRARRSTAKRLAIWAAFMAFLEKREVRV